MIVTKQNKKMRVEYSKIKVFFSSAVEMWVGQMRLTPIVGVKSFPVVMSTITSTLVILKCYYLWYQTDVFFGFCIVYFLFWK